MFIYIPIIIIISKYTKSPLTFVGTYVSSTTTYIFVSFICRRGQYVYFIFQIYLKNYYYKNTYLENDKNLSLLSKLIFSLVCKTITYYQGRSEGGAAL